MGVALLGSGCQDGYPLPPSPCDEWCDAAQIPCVAIYNNVGNPALCVRDCIRHGGDAPECQTEHDAAVTCLRGSSNAPADCSARYTDGVPRVCDEAQSAYEACAARYASGLGSLGWY